MTGLYNKMKDYLGRKMTSMKIVDKIDQLSQLVAQKMEQIIKIDSFGNSADESNMLLEQVLQIELEAHEISEKCLKCVSSCQSLDSDFTKTSLSMDCSIRAYQVLEQCAELQELLDITKLRLKSARNFFEDSLIAMESLEKLESEVSGIVSQSNQLIVDELVLKTRDVVKKLLEEGSLLLEQAGNRTNTDGVR